MSVTIVAALPKVTQASVAVTASAAPGSTEAIDIAETGADFASLLIGQLRPVVPNTLPESLKKADGEPLPADTPVADASPTETAQGDATATESAAFFAALGLVPMEPGRATADLQAGDSSLASIGKLDKPTSDPLPLTTTQTPVPAGTSLKQQALPASEVSDEPIKAAKFAAAPLVATNTEAVISKVVSPDAQPNTVSALVTNTPVSSHNLTTQPETTIAVPTSIRDQSWVGDFGQKIVWLASNNKQAAQLTLNPPQMGPIEISLNLDKGSATASFFSANSEVRDAIETALPRLREMFANAGISLGQTNVSAESFRQQAGNHEGNFGAPQWMSDKTILGADAGRALTDRAFAVQQGSGLVDIFA